VTPDPERRAVVFERELWRIAVEHLPWGEQHVWAALAGARVSSGNWRRAKAMLHFDQTGELRRRFLLTCLQRNRNSQLRVRALGEVGAGRDAEAFDEAVVIVGSWSRDERREGVKVLLQALAERPIGRRDQASAWLWHLAEFSREVHEEYAVQRWPETKRLLGLLVNSSGGAHARNARRLVQGARKQDRRLQAALLAAALAHTPEAEEVLRGARMRLARKPSALARELLRNFPKGRRGRRRRRRGGKGEAEANGNDVDTTTETLEGVEPGEVDDSDEPDTDLDTDADDGDKSDDSEASDSADDDAPPPPKKRRRPRKRPAAKPKADADDDKPSDEPTETDAADTRDDDLDRAA
jgi:ribonuclease E